jgi:NAD-dependent DNA ligase
MSLEQFFAGTNEDEIVSKIRQRRAQMLIHSCIYYELNDNIVSDHRWQRWADELEVLQRDNPTCCNIGFFDSEFSNWDGSTGNHLPHRNPWVLRKATYIIDLHRKLYGTDHVIP